MTFKKIWKRICCLFHDDRTRLRNGESVEDWEEVQQKRCEIEAENQRKEDEFLSTWFVRDEYINAGWFKRILLTIQFLFRDTHGKTGYQDPEAFARYYEAQKENYVGLQSEHEIGGKVYHVTNYRKNIRCYRIVTPQKQKYRGKSMPRYFRRLFLR